MDESRDVKLDSAMDIWRFEFSADTGYGYLLVIMKMRRLKIYGAWVKKDRYRSVIQFPIMAARSHGHKYVPGRDFMGPGNHDPVGATRWQETPKIA